MFDHFADDFHEMVTDAAGSVVGHFQSMPGSGAAFSDAFGNITHHVTPLPGGSMSVADAFGNTVARVAEMSDGALQISDSIGNTVGTIRDTFSGSTLFDSLSRPMSSFDPCTGNICDALGTLTGRVHSL